MTILSRNQLAHWSISDFSTEAAKSLPFNFKKGERQYLCTVITNLESWSQTLILTMPSIVLKLFAWNEVSSIIWSILPYNANKIQ